METTGGNADDAQLRDPGLLDVLEAATDLDTFACGVIAMDRTGRVVGYNRVESERAGLQVARVVGRHFFTDIGPCTNKYLVSERFDEAARSGTDLDVTLDYVFTFRMRPSPVRLRLLARAGAPRQYLVVATR